MRYGSVCSGIEAASVAWKPLGWTPAFFAEIDPQASAVLKHHHPEVKNYGDFTTITADAGPIDVLVGGTPCQSFSVAGLRGGLDDDRGNLALEFCRLADRLRPRWFVWENVPGVLSSNGGRDFGSILGAMGELGYGTAYRILDAQYAGVPQRRRRVFVVGYLGDWRRAAAVLFERHSLSGDTAPRREAGQSFTHSVAPSLTSSGRGTERAGDSRGQDAVIACIPILEAGARTGKSTDDIRAGSGIGDPGDPMYTLQSGKQHGVFALNGHSEYGGEIPTLRAKGGDCAGGSEMLITSGPKRKWEPKLDPPISKEETLRRFGVEVPYISHCLNAGGMGRIDYETETLVTATLRANGDAHSGFRDTDGLITFEANMSQQSPHSGGIHQSLTRRHHAAVLIPPAVSLAIRGRDGVPQIEMGDEVANAILTPNGGRGGIGVGAMMQGSAVRRLTPLECARLQGFPDDYFDGVQYRGKPLADGPIYKMLGNSMAVPCMRWIGERIAMVEAL